MAEFKKIIKMHQQEVVYSSFYLFRQLSIRITLV